MEGDAHCSADSLAKGYLSDERRRSGRTEVDGSGGWTIAEAGLTVAGRGVVATRDYGVGDVIFVDTALVVAPRVEARGRRPLCAACYAAVAVAVACPRGCRLPVCDARCADRPEHSRDCLYVRGLRPKPGDAWSVGLYNALAAIRSVSLKDGRYARFLDVLQKRSTNRPVFEVEELKRNTNSNLDEEDEQIMKTTCKIMDANAFETTTNRCGNLVSLRGLYPVAAFMNHCCVPNTMFNYNKNLQMIVKASLPIYKGQEITTTYTYLIWPTSIRQQHLVTSKQFICTCNRCCDNEEFGTKLGVLNCLTKNCSGYIYSINPLHNKSFWQCKICTKLISSCEILSLYKNIELLMNNINIISEKNLETILKTYNIHSNNSFALNLKLKFIWDSKKNKSLTLEQLLFKEKSCFQILNIIQKLRLGQCRLTGLISQELMKVINEKSDRFSWETKTLNIFKEQIRNLKEISSCILDGDANTQ